jgi:Uncharacterized proteins, homologs of microcin C7 resistance protein MccF
MIYPKFINKHHTIGITAPSDGIIHEERLNRLENAKKHFLKLGIDVIETDSIRCSNNGRSTDAKSRANELELLLKNNIVDAVICISGGDFLLEMLPYFDFELFRKNPKWLQGYSDPSGLTFVLTTKYDIATIYSHNFLGFGQEIWHSSVKDNFDLLMGENIVQNNFDKYEKESVKYVTGLEGYNLDTRVEWKSLTDKDINIEGRLIGGCLDIITELIGTPYDSINSFIDKYKADGIIWFFDNAELSTEDIVRTMWKFEECGYFKHTKGILFGRSANESSFYDISFKETLSTSLSHLNVPILYDMDFGHLPPRMTIINGSFAHIMFKNNNGSIEFEYK